MLESLPNPVPATNCVRVSSSPATGQPIVVCDFDQTICLGDGPLWAYAEAVGVELDHRDRDRLFATLRDYLARRVGGVPIAPGEPPDGYGMVWLFAHPLVPDEVISAALLASRARLAAEGLGVYASPGSADLLGALAGSAYRVLMSKSPGVGVAETLERIGLTEAFDLVIAGADKPRIWPDVVRGLVGDDGAAQLLCAVGDNWVNDIDVPHRLGCATAWITAQANPDRPALLTGRDIAAVAPAVRHWVAEHAKQSV